MIGTIVTIIAVGGWFLIIALLEKKIKELEARTEKLESQKKNSDD